MNSNKNKCSYTTPQLHLYDTKTNLIRFMDAFYPAEKELIEKQMPQRDW